LLLLVITLASNGTCTDDRRIVEIYQQFHLDHNVDSVLG